MHECLGNHKEENTDNATILLKMVNGSTGVINYFANGSKSYSKERIEIYSQQKTIVIDNFRKAEFFGFSRSNMKSSQDKGHTEQFRRWIQSVQDGGIGIIPVNEIFNTSRAVILAVESMKEGKWMAVGS